MSNGVTLVDLFKHDMLDFDIILGMDVYIHIFLQLIVEKG